MQHSNHQDFDQVIQQRIRFEDIFQITELQHLQEIFSEATGLASIITDPEGIPYTKPTNITESWSKIIQRSSLGLGTCFNLNFNIQSKTPSGPEINTSLGNSLMNAVAPIVVENIHIANWHIGLVKNENPNQLNLKIVADEIRIETELMSKAYDELPSMPIVQLKKYIEMQYIFLNSLLEKSYENWKLKNENQTLVNNQQAIEDTNILMKLFLEYSPIYTYIKEVKPDESLVLIASENFIDMVGIPGSQMKGKNMHELFPKSFAEKITSDDWEVCQKGKMIKLEEELDGKYYTTYKFPIKQGEKTFLAGYTIDISSRKYAEKALKFSEERFRKAFFINPDSININKLETGEYVQVNKSFLKTMGYTLDEVLGKTSIDLNNWCNKEDRVRLVSELREKGYIQNLEAQFRTKNNQIIHGLMSAAIIDLEGEPHIISITRDITMRKQWEELLNQKNKEYEILNEQLKIINNDLNQAKEKAEESDRLKTAFLQNMSHEIRTPMNAIMGFSSLLTESYNDLPRLEKYSQIINQRCNDLLSIINDILDIAKIESGQLTVNEEECDLNLFFSELVDFFSEHQKKMGKQHIKFELNAFCNPGEIRIITDKVKLRQIFINLLSNAFKFTQEGSVIGGCRFNDQHLLEFYLSDTGIGIPPDKQSYIFERFAQLEHRHSKNIGGTGLGLSIVKGLIDLLGGNFQVESVIGKGTTFRFTISYKITLPKIEQQKVNNPPQFDFNNSLLAIVEDDYYNIAYLEEILSKTGFTLVSTKFGKDIVELCKNRPIDIVLMDIRLPDMNGYEATKKIREFNKDIIIIAQTAYASLTEKNQALSAGCNDYISKPINQNDLLTLIMKNLKQKKS